MSTSSCASGSGLKRQVARPPTGTQCPAHLLLFWLKADAKSVDAVRQRPRCTRMFSSQFGRSSRLFFRWGDVRRRADRNPNIGAGDSEEPHNNISNNNNRNSNRAKDVAVQRHQHNNRSATNNGRSSRAGDIQYKYNKLSTISSSLSSSSSSSSPQKPKFTD
eukprot:PhM_4_TR15971/c0_g1_i1/m.98037